MIDPKQIKFMEGSEMLFLCYERCSTCQKAKRFLDNAGISYTWRDIRGQNPTREELARWHAQSGLPLRRFFNTSGLAYKALNLKEKLPQMSQEQQLDLLASDGMLVKRPMLIGDSFVLVGFKEETWRQQLGL